MRILHLFLLLYDKFVIVIDFISAFLYNFYRVGEDMKILFVEDDDAIALGLIYSLEKRRVSNHTL